MLKKYLEQRIEFHKLLNSEDCPNDIDEQYKQLKKKYIDIGNKTNSLLSTDNNFYSPHDGVIKKIKYDKLGNLYLKFNSFVYDLNNHHEIGYQEITLTVKVNKIIPLKAEKKSTIYELKISDNQLGLIVFDKNGDFQIDIIDYNNLELKKSGNLSLFGSKVIRLK